MWLKAFAEFGNEVALLVDRHQHIGPVVIGLVFDDHLLQRVQERLRLLRHIRIAE